MAEEWWNRYLSRGEKSLKRDKEANKKIKSICQKRIGSDLTDKCSNYYWLQGDLELSGDKIGH